MEDLTMKARTGPKASLKDTAQQVRTLNEKADVKLESKSSIGERP